ncbi:MAG TPA: EF-P beta-lysylation protein EpmB [Thermoanaerobaculia bacterium]|nr:EF-P beta-lysylation protein EpmB [Thermoanaerobaculia bacterium]
MGWQRALGDAVDSVGELLALVGVVPQELPSHLRPDAAAGRDFALRVPRGFVARMRAGDPRDPLLLQVLPTAAELVAAPGFSADPLAETVAADAVSPLPGVLHKYRGRALLLVTGACGVHCRYCFRRHFPYVEHARWGEGFERALAWLRASPGIEEVILSGGDPLSVGDDRLGELAAGLAGIPHLRRLRVHSRMPVILPERIDAPLLQWLAGGEGASGARRPLAPVLVLHANHARELDGAVAAAVGRLRAAGVTVLNQAVLLAGVNDSLAALCDLSRALLDAGVLPYYLHLLDRVAGAAHFEVADERAQALLRGMMEELPGYLVPRLVREVPGAPYKVPLPLVG